jgi:hypothetical protein
VKGHSQWARRSLHHRQITRDESLILNMLVVGVVLARWFVLGSNTFVGITSSELAKSSVLDYIQNIQVRILWLSTYTSLEQVFCISRHHVRTSLSKGSSGRLYYEAVAVINCPIYRKAMFLPQAVPKWQHVSGTNPSPTPY